MPLIHNDACLRHGSAGFEIAVQDVAEPQAVCPRHACDVFFDVLEERRTVESIGQAAFFEFLEGAERVSVVFLPVHLGGDPVIDLPFHERVEELKADVCEELSNDLFHTLLLLVGNFEKPITLL